MNYRKIPLLIGLITASLFSQSVQKPSHEASPEEIAAFPAWREQQRSAYSTRAGELPVNPRAIAEYEPMEAVVISYQSFGSNEFGFNTSFVKTLAEEIRVMILCDDYGVTSLERELGTAQVNMDSVTILPYKTDSYWTRDYAPWWIAEGDQQISIVDFVYNRPRDNDDRVNGNIASFLGDVPLYKMDLVQCGGNYMCDGISSAAATDLVIEENRDKSEAEVRQLMESYLGISDYHIRPDPLGDYIKHVDCWGKYLAPNKILIADVSASDPRKGDFDEAAEYFANLTSPLGTPFEVYRAFSDNEPYTNSLIINDRVFVPIKGSANDEKALEVYRTVMPGYTVVGVKNTTGNPWLHTDALHCRTRGVPDRKMLYISHTPGGDTLVSDPTFTLTSAVIDYSKKGLMADSLLCYYRVKGENAYLTAPLTTTDDSLFTAEIPPHWEGTADLEYYFSVQDSGGKRSFYPFIGKADPITVPAKASIPVALKNLGGIETTFLSVTAQAGNVSVVTGEKGTLSLYRANGQRIFRESISGGRNLLPVSNSGIILYEWKSGGIAQTGKLLIK